ncbi:MAG TPA: SUF system NifU family Fe-S cluster assembly protein [Bacilli bacterium]|nr:SUF system NifU family Fe-S cluster assembly protein [Bacilli bacterium]
MDSELKRAIIMNHYQNPLNNEVIDNSSYQKINNNNLSCIDNIDLYLLIEDGIIKDLKFAGEGCAISTAASSLLTKLVIGKSALEAENIITNYEKMINEEPYDQELLKEANCFDEIYKQQNRKQCALLPWQGLKKALLEKK